MYLNLANWIFELVLRLNFKVDKHYSPRNLLNFDISRQQICFVFVVWPVCLMFRRLIRQIVSAVKTLKMSELTRVEAPSNAAAAKRPFEETQDAANGIKKMKTLPDEVCTALMSVSLNLYHV